MLPTTGGGVPVGVSGAPQPHRALLPGQRRDGNLAEVSQALCAVGIAHGLVPDRPPRHRLAIAPGDRTAALEALHRLPRPARHSCAGRGGRFGAARAALPLRPAAGEPLSSPGQPGFVIPPKGVRRAETLRQLIRQPSEVRTTVSS